MVLLANFAGVHVGLGRIAVGVLVHMGNQAGQMVQEVNYGDILEDNWVDNVVGEGDAPSVEES